MIDEMERLRARHIPIWEKLNEEHLSPNPESEPE